MKKVLCVLFILSLMITFSANVEAGRCGGRLKSVIHKLTHPFAGLRHKNQRTEEPQTSVDERQQYTIEATAEVVHDEMEWRCENGVCTLVPRSATPTDPFAVEMERPRLMLSAADFRIGG